MFHSFNALAASLLVVVALAAPHDAHAQQDDSNEAESGGEVEEVDLNLTSIRVPGNRQLSDAQVRDSLNGVHSALEGCVRTAGESLGAIDGKVGFVLSVDDVGKVERVRVFKGPERAFDECASGVFQEHRFSLPEKDGLMIVVEYQYAVIGPDWSRKLAKRKPYDSAAPDADRGGSKQSDDKRSKRTRKRPVLELVEARSDDADGDYIDSVRSTVEAKMGMLSMCLDAGMRFDADSMPAQGEFRFPVAIIPNGVVADSGVHGSNLPAKTKRCLNNHIKRIRFDVPDKDRVTIQLRLRYEFVDVTGRAK